MSLPKAIAGIRFGLLSPDEIRKMSVKRITNPDTYDEEGVAIPNGLMDRELGTIEPGVRCTTCENKLGPCPGHFGHIELHAPMIHIGFNKTIYKILQTICSSCSRIMLEPRLIKRYTKKLREYKEQFGTLDQAMLENIWKRAKKTRDSLMSTRGKEDDKKVCLHCEEIQHKVRLDKPTNYYEEYETADGNKVTDKLTTTDVLNRLKNIPDDDAILLGIDSKHARPEYMILEVLPVPPVAVRPSITLDSGIRSEDDLTHKLVEIIRINQRLYEYRESGAPQLIIDDLAELLQYHVTTYLDNEVSGIPPARHRSGRALRTLTQRLKGKEGRFRSNLSGKRVDFSARTVVSPDPLLSINQVGVPKKIAEILTVPEKVTEWNIEEMRELVMQGPSGSPGVNYIVKNEGRRVALRFVRDLSFVKENLKPGDVIERHLRDGDIVLFNRQPSLHRMSIMAHEVKVMPYKTFRLNLSVCLSGETELYTDLGKVKIKEIVRDISRYSPLSVNWNTDKSAYYSGISKEHTIAPSELGLKSYQIVTRTGRRIEATQEHPFYTSRGEVIAGELKIKDQLAILPVEYPEIDLFSKPIASRKDFINFLPSSSSKNYTLKMLDDLNFFDLSSSDSRRVVLARLVGRLIGDDSLLIRPEGGRIIFRSQEKGSIEKIWNDVKSLGIVPGSIKQFTSRGYEVEDSSGKVERTIGSIFYFEIRKKPIALYFNFLGVPEGDRAPQGFGVPEWIINGTKMEKREFLRAYFGAEMSTPKIRETSNKLIDELRFNVARSNEKDAFQFLEDIGELLSDFEVMMSIRGPVKGNIRKKDDSFSLIFTGVINSEESNVYHFLTRLGFEYAEKKEIIARQVSEYYRHKQLAIEAVSSQLQKAKELRAVTHEAIAENVGAHSWSSVASGLNIDVKHAGSPSEFPSFEEWRVEYTLDNESGLIWDEILEIKEIFLPLAYDITTTDENHNFIAEGFLTSNCRPYNADFDGDEMNLHVPQSEEARAEAHVLMKVQEQISTPRYGGPIIGGIQDFITAVYFLTRKDTILDKKIASEYVAAAGLDLLPPPDTTLDGKPAWSGKSMFSLLLPKGLNYDMKNKLCTCTKDREDKTCPKEGCPTEGYVIIRDGKLLHGVIDKSCFGAEVPNSVLHRILKEFGTIETRKFLDGLTRMLIAHITRRGFSMGINDVDVPQEGRMRITERIQEAENSVQELIDQYESGKLERSPGQTLMETLEGLIQDELAKARDDAGNIAAEYLGMRNSAVIMAKIGARGNMLNLGQMSACVGQQSVRGNRIHRGYRERTLPHFRQGDLSADAKGFVTASFRKGLSPIEFFMHACGGREGLVDTAVRTSNSGYMQRRLVNAMQDLSSNYDRTVRNSTGEIIQFVFGDDNIDPAKSDSGKAVNLDVILERVLAKEE